MEIKELFNGNIDDIRFKIKELQNAAQVAETILELSEIEKLILKAIIYSSKMQVMGFLYEWFNPIKLIFSRLPSDEDLKLEAKQYKEEYKLLKEEEMKNASGEDTDDEATQISETDNSDNLDEENKGQDTEDADDEASEIIEASDDDDNENKCNGSKDGVNDIDSDSEGTNEVDEDSENENDEKSVKSSDGSEADEEDIKDIDDGFSDTSTKYNDEQGSVKSINEN